MAITDAELADKIVSLGVGESFCDDAVYFPDDNHWIGKSKFVRDERVAMALMEKVDAHFIERLTKSMWAVRSDKPYGEGKTREWYENESLPRAIIEACVEALS